VPIANISKVWIERTYTPPSFMCLSSVAWSNKLCIVVTVGVQLKPPKIAENDIHQTFKISPPLVTNSGTRKSCSFARTLVNLWKSATLLRLRRSSILSLRTHLWGVSTMYSLCSHVIQSAAAISVTNARLESMRSSSWVRLSISVCIRASSKGRTSP